LYNKNVAGHPITNGVGANNNCSAQLIQVGSKGMTGNLKRIFSKYAGW
jgi:hypothetical protein